MTMNSVIQTMIAKYNPQNDEKRESAIKEIIQEIALAGLSRAGFFNKAAFYGGTCLRIFHGLNRFSEDLDFALLEKDPNFKLDNYFPSLKKEDIATVTYLTALIIASSIKKFILDKQKKNKPRVLIISGGGVYNKTLMQFLSSELKEVKVISLEEAGIHPMAKEAAAFAYFAWRTLEGVPSSCPSATGAKRKVLLGTVYPAVK
jgi:hypothetical protein